MTLRLNTKPYSSVKRQTHLSTRTLWAEWPLHPKKMDASAVYGRAVLEKVDIWIFTCDARKTKMGLSKKKLLSGRYCHHCWCYSPKRILVDWQSSEYKIGLQRIGPLRLHPNQDQRVGKTCDQDMPAPGGYGIRQWTIFFLFLHLSCLPSLFFSSSTTHPAIGKKTVEYSLKS